MLRVHCHAGSIQGHFYPVTAVVVAAAPSFTAFTPPPTVEPTASMPAPTPGTASAPGGAPVISPTSGIDPRPFAVSGVMRKTLTITDTTPANSAMRARYRMIVTTHAAIGFETGSSVALEDPS